MSTYQNTLAHAQGLDAVDPLRSFHGQLARALQPKAAADAMKQELDDWEPSGWKDISMRSIPGTVIMRNSRPVLARLVGALPEEKWW
jgi:hypothetical protein